MKTKTKPTQAEYQKLIFNELVALRYDLDKQTPKLWFLCALMVLGHALFFLQLLK